jgi:iron complex transport system permease protein
VFRLVVGRVPGEGVSLGFEHLDVRFVRVLAGAIVGITLAVSGVFLQVMLRNPLASPDIMGLASGSGLGVMLAALAAYRAGLGNGVASAPGLGAAGSALAGALVALGVVYALSRHRGVLEPVRVVLVGVSISVICSAATMFVRQFLPDQGLGAARYVLGILRDETPSGELWAGGVVATVGLLIGMALGPALDAASLDEDESRSVGLRLDVLRVILFLTSGIMTAASVVIAGPVGFVGLICPHVVRMAVGPGHRVLVLGAAMTGVTLVVGCDVLVRAIDLGSGQLPIGVLTSLIGAPVLITMVRRDRIGLSRY